VRQMNQSAEQPSVALRSIRRQKGWTLSEVSQRTGLPVSTLSKVENGKMSLTYDKLVRISKGLEIDLAQLFSHVDGGDSKTVSGRRSIARAGEGHAIETKNYGHLYPASDLLNKHFIPIVAEIRARSLSEFGEMIRHSGEEYAYVLEGDVELHTDLYAPVLLKTGDSIYFDSGMAHAYIAATDARCRVLSICSASEMQLQSAIRPEPPEPESAQKPRGKPARPQSPREAKPVKVAAARSRAIVRRAGS
jgi:transcriptional regulator with XRE-family HTH domain